MQIIKTDNVSVVEVLDAEVVGPAINEDDKAIVQQLFGRSAENVEVYIPDDIDADTLEAWMSSGARVRAKLGFAIDKIKPALGRMFQVVQNRPDLLERFGCKSHSQFMNHYVPKNFWMSPQEAWSAFFTANEFVGISGEDYEKVGITKLKQIAAAVPYMRENKNEPIPENIVEQRRMLIEEAKKPEYKKSPIFAARIEELGIAKKNQIIKTQIRIFTDEQTEQAWEEFCQNPNIIRHVGTDHPPTIFKMMMHECYASWIAETLGDE